VETARVDAELLACHVLGVTRGELAAALVTGRDLSFDLERYDQLVGDRAQRIPLQHLTGTAAFRRLELAVGPGVFIPRPETEAVTQVAIDEVNAAASANPEADIIAVDLCTGSGAIALALAQETGASHVHAVEYSELAFAWAEQNLALFAHAEPAAAARVQLHQADATQAATLSELDGRVAVVVSNPPYIPPGQVPKDIEVREHDPEIALYGRGDDGLKVPLGVLNRAQRLLHPGGVLVLEHAEVQARALREAALAAGTWSEITTRPDFAGRPRMLYAKYSPSGPEVGQCQT